MIDLGVADHLSDICIQKLHAVRFLLCLVKIHGAWFISGQVIKEVLHVVLYFIFVLVHCLIAFLISLFLFHSNEHLVQV